MQECNNRFDGFLILALFRGGLHKLTWRGFFGLFQIKIQSITPNLGVRNKKITVLSFFWVKIFSLFSYKKRARTSTDYLKEMASRIRTPALAAVCLLLLLAAAPASDAAISCSDVIKDLRPCVNYLVNGTGKPPSACCAGASALASAASSSSDKKAACECIKSAAKNMKPNAQLAQALPANCGINLPVTIAPNVDCSKVG
ncbi:hypothetical protein QUC31_008585 [Theobroma cacao]|uniref:Non-specific lipid-transfer protein n=2 Tax=Theobroma cacao TaxID=3641 RepID=A0A061G2K3_THECC|nr:Bifunctional inhibitor/lipid-transfer protein/seed storage 2S albumin superfamily protein [Theobroma cacao]